MTSYLSRGTSRIYWAGSVADIGAPTVAEMVLAVDVTCDLVGGDSSVRGVRPLYQVAQIGDVTTHHARSYVTVAQAAPIELDFYDDDTGLSVPRALWATPGAEGVLVFARYGAAVLPGSLVDVFPAQTAGVSDGWRFGGRSAAQTTARFAVTGRPGRDVQVVV